MSITNGISSRSMDLYSVATARNNTGTAKDGTDATDKAQSDRNILDGLNQKKQAGAGGSGLGINDFMKLLVAQLQNQDMMNPMADTDFIAQMAQFSSLEAMTAVAETNVTSYAASLVGKEVTVASLDKKGELVKVEGTVTGMSLFEGRPMIYVDGKAYELNQVMCVGKLPDPPKDEEGDGEGGDEVPAHPIVPPATDEDEVPAHPIVPPVVPPVTDGEGGTGETEPGGDGGTGGE